LRIEWSYFVPPGHICWENNLDKASSLRLSGPVPDGTTEDDPLIVVAPAPREQQPGKLRRFLCAQFLCFLGWQVDI
jgi:hypothetical protein